MISNTISKLLQEYLEYKHSLGFKLMGEGYVLNRFARYTLSRGYDGSLTMDIVLDWIASEGGSDKTKGRRLEAIRPFSKYIAAFDTSVQSIEERVFRNTHDRPKPYIYSEKEVGILLEECDNLYSPDGIRAYSMKTIIGLLWSTGMRPSEPLKLCTKDVDFIHSTILIRENKFSKDRIIPVADTVIQNLSLYKAWIESRIGPLKLDSPFFYTTHRKPLDEGASRYAFGLIRDSINAQPEGYTNVRLYDFRHTFATRTIIRWFKQGIDVNSKLYILSAYLGHVHPRDTYWYLSATPELLDLACSKYEAQFGGDNNE